MAWQMTLADALPAEPNRLWQLDRQLGVTAAVTTIPETVTDTGWIHHPPVWSHAHLRELKDRFAEAGFDLQVIESSPHSLTEPIRLGLPDREEKLDRFCELLENMGSVGIPVICPNWMPVFGPLRTSRARAGRGGALATAYDHAALRDAPLTSHGVIHPEQLWENASVFLERVIPVAEAAGVTVAIHPDDPPVQSIRGVSRILINPDALQRWIDLVPSPANGITFCQGTIASMGVDVPATIRRFGSQQKIHFVHFRDVDGNPPEEFTETFQDNGRTDMAAAVEAYREVGFTGPMRIDHAPSMAGEDNSNPGYETLGRLFAIGYVKGLMEAVDTYA